MKSILLFWFAFTFMFFSITATAQNQPKKIESSTSPWLGGKWEGSGFADLEYHNAVTSSKRVNAHNFEFAVQSTQDSIRIQLKGTDQNGTSRIYLNETLSVESFEEGGNKKDIRLLFLSPYPEGGRSNDRELVITQVNKNHINLSLTYYTRREEQNLILHGAFKRIKN